MLVASLALGSMIALDPFREPGPFGEPGTGRGGTAPQIAAPLILPPAIVVPEMPRVALAPVEKLSPPSMVGPREPVPLPPDREQQVAGLPPILMPEPPHFAIPVPPAPSVPAIELGLADPPDGYLREKTRTALLTRPSQIAAAAPLMPAPEAPQPRSSAPTVATLPPPSGATAEFQDLGFHDKLVLAAHKLTTIPGGYDPKYMKIAYPMGDVPEGMGVCTDVIVRAYRGLGVDLQELVHHSRLGTGDTNVDHRRVQVLIKFFAKYGENIPVSRFPESYKPGDIVAYDVPWGRTSKWHIAIVTDQLSPSLRPMVVHNRGYGAKLEDALFHKRIIGHYRLDAQSLTALQIKTLPAQASAVVATQSAGQGAKPERRVLARVAIPRS